MLTTIHRWINLIDTTTSDENSTVRLGTPENPIGTLKIEPVDTQAEFTKWPTFTKRAFTKWHL